MTDQLDQLDSELKACAEENAQRFMDKWGDRAWIIFWAAVLTGTVVTM